MSVRANSLVNPAWQRFFVSHESKQKPFKINYLKMKNNKKPQEKNSRGDNCNIYERRTLHLQIVEGVLC